MSYQRTLAGRLSAGHLYVNLMNIARDLALYASLLVMTGCSICENDVVSSALSPSGKWKAVVFQRGCGATTDFNTQVSVLPAERGLPDDSGNIYVIDGKGPVNVSWMSDSELEVRAKVSRNVYKQELSIAGVRVNYVQ